MDRDNTSIENQKDIISDFVKTRFPQSALTFYEDRDRSGYTFEQRESYQKMRRELMNRSKDILIVKDFSRFSRRNSRGLVELEDLRDAGARIISIGDGIDFPNDDDWLKIQFQFLINEMPVTDTSRKVRSVIKRRQAEGQWICAAPYGYWINRNREFEVIPAEAEVIRKIYDLYSHSGWGYKKIANYLTDQGIPTPRMSEAMRREANGEACRRSIKASWSIISVQGILDNDFYIGTFRQGKFTRAKINGKDVRRDEAEQIVIEDHHPPILDKRTFSAVRALRQKRTRCNYRGIKKYDNVYSGFLTCGDCGSPMFSVSRGGANAAYTCGAYHQRGLAGCTSHHVRVDKLDALLKSYMCRVMENSEEMLRRMNVELSGETEPPEASGSSADALSQALDSLREELKATKRQRIKDVMKHPDQEALLEETYNEMESDLQGRMEGIRHQMELFRDRRQARMRVNETAKTAMQIFREVIGKEHLDRTDLELLIERIVVYEDHLEIQLKSDMDTLFRCENPKPEEISNQSKRKESESTDPRKDRFADVHVVSKGDPLEIYTDHDGEVVLKKYSPIGEIAAIAKDYSDSLHRTLGHVVLICDRDAVVSSSGAAKREFMEKPLSGEMDNLLQSRRMTVLNRISGAEPVSVTADDCPETYTAQIIAPITADGEIIGGLILLSRDMGTEMGDIDRKVAETTAGIIGKQMEQ